MPGVGRKLTRTTLFIADDQRERSDELAVVIRRASGYRLSLSEAVRISLDAALDVWNAEDFAGLRDTIGDKTGEDAATVVERRLRDIITRNMKRSVKGGAKVDHGGGGKLDHPAGGAGCLRAAVRAGWSGVWPRPEGGPRRSGGPSAQPAASRGGGLRAPGRLRGAVPSCCGRDGSSRRSAPGCGRDG